MGAAFAIHPAIQQRRFHNPLFRLGENRDRQAAAALQSRIDWKYALGLKLSNPGFDCSVLSEFRDRLIEGQAVKKMLDTIAGAV